MNRNAGISVAALCVFAGLAQAQSDDPIALGVPAQATAPIARFFGPVKQGFSTMYANNQVIPFNTQDIWKPICSNRAALTVADLQNMATTHAAAMADPTKVIVVDSINPAAGLDLVYTLGGSVPAGAVAAFAAAEAYLEGQFPNDTMTVNISVSFAALSPGVIGGTSSASGYVDWPNTRLALQSGADASDTIQASLPSGTTIPVRYRTNTTTNETRVFWTLANWKATGGTATGTDANMQYSTAFPFDYDPSNGVTANTISLQDVIIHETGHALGFSSGVDFRSSDIEVPDIFRFRRTDGNGDFNPDTTAEFTARPRWAVRNNPDDDVNFDDIASEIRFSDGSPWQASHWREQVPAIGIMDPAFNYAETFYPNFLRATDLTGFDAFGYDK